MVSTAVWDKLVFYGKTALNTKTRQGLIYFFITSFQADQQSDSPKFWTKIDLPKSTHTLSRKKSSWVRTLLNVFFLSAWKQRSVRIFFKWMNCSKSSFRAFFHLRVVKTWTLLRSCHKNSVDIRFIKCFSTYVITKEKQLEQKICIAGVKFNLHESLLNICSVK